MSIFGKSFFVGLLLVTASACGASSEKSVDSASVSDESPCEVPSVVELSFEESSVYYSGSIEILEGKGCEEVELIEAWNEASCSAAQSEFFMLDVESVSETKAEITICGAKS